jgi:hypothetical protein
MHGAKPSHLTICADGTGWIEFYPDRHADPEVLYAALKAIVRLFNERPEALRCAAGACAGECDHAERQRN